jgi:hypothetical protein
MRRPLARSVLCLGVLLALLGAPRILEAAEPDNVSVARAAYDRGARAFNAGQYVAAAREFSVADELAPNPVALRFALQAVLFLDDPVLGMTLVQRAGGRNAPELDRLVVDARAKFAHRVGRITLTGPEASVRLARIDGAPVTRTTWVTPGTHAIEWQGGGLRSVHVEADDDLEISAPRPPEPPAPPPPATEGTPAGSGISPAWFWVGVALTTIGGVATLGSGLDTVSKHRTFADDPNSQTQSQGESAQLRTNIFIGATALCAVTTAAIGLFATRWSESRTSAYLYIPEGGGTRVAVGIVTPLP